MSVLSPLALSQQILVALGTRMFLYYADRIPRSGAVLVVSNHRSFMDAPLLMAAINRPIRFACHHYMGQVPVLREVITRFGCFPLDPANQQQTSFFHRAVHFLQNQQCVGVFPEGAQPMVQLTQPERVTEFHRGFAHLALKAPLTDLAILPIAIASQEEVINHSFPLQLLSWFDPSEPLFAQSGWHPLVVYQRVNVLIGHPIWITSAQRQAYMGKQAKAAVIELTEKCQSQIYDLLQRGLW
jgi:1-acyl-sn-glycerol-3-phosphate acyltransferase